VDVELLERPQKVELSAEYRNNKHELSVAAIPADWVLEGYPVSRNRLLSSSSDGMASTYMWDCTAGRFYWFYDIDETICLLEGSMVIVDAAGVRRRLSAGDTFFFPAGSRFEWTVSNYVRKIAFLHAPLSPPMRFIKRAFGALKRVVRPRRRTHTESTFGSR
jgi:uncharacterized cupin superfamily protein